MALLIISDSLNTNAHALKIYQNWDITFLKRWVSEVLAQWSTECSCKYVVMQCSRGRKKGQVCIYCIYNEIWDKAFLKKKMCILLWHFIQYNQIGTSILNTYTTIEAGPSIHCNPLPQTHTHTHTQKSCWRDCIMIINKLLNMPL